MAFVWSTNEISKKTVTIYSTNLTLNTAACKNFENVQYVLLGVDKENNLLGIKPVDKTAIDGFRGDVSKEEINEELEKEGKYRADNVMTVIKDQEKVYKMNERADIIEEQLKIAQEYELEDY